MNAVNKVSNYRGGARTGSPANSRKEQGAIVIIAVISMLALMGIAALALDGGHLLLNKTRLQNAVDAAALSAAKTLDDSGDTLLAEVAAMNTFTLTAMSPGNGEIADGIAEMNFSFEFSDTLFPFVHPGGSPAFVRVTVTDLPLQPFFMVALGLTDKRVRASAVSGPSPTLDNEVCNIVPVMACGLPDSDPDDDIFFGYDQGDLQVLKMASGDDSEVGPGNFQLIRLPGGQGGADLREALAGGFEGCLSTGEVAETEPGNSVGPVVQGLNMRFGEASGPLDSDVYNADFVTDFPVDPTPDLQFVDGAIQTSEGTPIDTAADLAAAFNTDYSFHGNYSEQYAANGFDPDTQTGWDPDSGQFHRRVLTLPLGDCSGTTNGQGQVPLFGFGCFFLLQPVVQKGTEAQVFGEFVEGCDSFGTFSMDPGTGPAPTRIILYKDPDSLDS